MPSIKIIANPISPANPHIALKSSLITASITMANNKRVESSFQILNFWDDQLKFPIC